MRAVAVYGAGDSTTVTKEFTGYKISIQIFPDGSNKRAMIRVYNKKGKSTKDWICSNIYEIELFKQT